jgi:hypothetical protein
MTYCADFHGEDEYAALLYFIDNSAKTKSKDEDGDEEEETEQKRASHLLSSYHCLSLGAYGSTTRFGTCHGASNK